MDEGVKEKTYFSKIFFVPFLAIFRGERMTVLTHLTLEGVGGGRCG